MDIATIAEQICRPAELWSAGQIGGADGAVLKVPGIYAWYFDRVPALVPTETCRRWKGLWLLYVGISPAYPPNPGAAKGRQTLARRLKQHFLGNASASTLRLSLGCLLASELGIGLRVSGKRMTFGADGERRLNSWMQAHARVACVTYERPWETELGLIDMLSPPLNLKDNLANPFQDQLRKVRRDARERAREAAKLSTGVQY